ncbi:MAG TPA: histidine kinase [Gammaproteobacteria bacterium]
MNSDKASDFFLPNFCERRMVFAVVVLAELFAFILTLAQASYASEPWLDLALISLFMQWTSLSGAAVLCLLRKWLERLEPVWAIVATYLLLLLVIVAMTEAAFVVLGGTMFIPRAGNHLDFLLRNIAIGGIVSALALRYFYMQQQMRKRLQAEASARLDALHARIRPHFLFNSMNTIASLIGSHPEQAEEAVEDLSDLFRASLGKENHFLPLAEELYLTHRYLHIEGLRLGERLQVEWQIAYGVDTLLLPPLILQPLVENAVYHGIEPRPDGGTVIIGAAKSGDELQLWVSNPVVEAETITPRSGNRVALNNIRERLAAHYGEQATLTMSSGEERVVVRITLPLQQGRETK